MSHQRIRLISARFEKIALSVMLAALAAATASVQASITLTNIPFADWQTNASGVPDVANGAYGISPDGRFVIGYSTPGNNKGYLYDLNGPAMRRPLGEGAAANTLSGIAYRTDTNQDPAQVQLVLDGQSAGVQMNWMTADGGLTWGAKRRNTAFTAATTFPIVNSLGATTGSDAFYTLVRNSSSQNAYTLLGVGLWTSTSGVVPTMTYINKGVNSPSSLAMNAVAATGRAVGYRNDGAGRFLYVMDYPPSSGTAWSFTGLDGTTFGEAFSISLDGNIIFGHSYPDPINRPGRWPFKAVVTNTLNSLQSIYELPRFPDTTGSTGNAGVPYACTADGRYAAGMTYRGSERAALWDTSSADPSKWQVVDLTALAAANGNLDVFLRLTRAYGVATNAAGNIVIVGLGADTNASPNTRGFVMTITPPITAVGFPPVVAVSGSYPAGYSFTFQTVTNALGANTISNFLEYATNLNPPATWTVVTGELSTGSPMTFSDPNPTDAQRFYRIHITP